MATNWSVCRCLWIVEEVKMIQEFYICAMRYCFYRKSYMPSVIQRALIDEFNNLEEATVNCMIRDIETELESCKVNDTMLGQSFDHHSWLEFYYRLKELREERWKK